MKCASCGGSKWFSIRRLKESKTSVTMYDLMHPHANGPMPIQSQCVHCNEWQDEDLPEGWRIRAAHAVVREKGFRLKGDQKKPLYYKTFNFKTIAREYNHSRRMVVEYLRKNGFHEDTHHIHVTHSSWRNKGNYAHHYTLIDGWQIKKEKQQKETKTMDQKISLKRHKNDPEGIEPVQGFLYETKVGDPKYVVMALNSEHLCHPNNFRAVVVWSDRDAPHKAGKLFPHCSKTAFKEFEGKITIEQP
jgi:hypothetical protein